VVAHGRSAPLDLLAALDHVQVLLPRVPGCNPASGAGTDSLHGFGVACIVIGYLVWVRRPDLSIGPMILFLGAAYHLQDLRASSNPLLFGVGFALPR